MPLNQQQKPKELKSIFGSLLATEDVIVHERFGEEPLAAIIADLAPCQQNHPYLTAHGLVGAPCKVFTGTDEIGGVQCHGSAAALVCDADGTPVNVLLMVRKSDTIFEDVLIPGAKLQGCYARIGYLTDTILIVEDYRSGLALHNATGYCVAVTLYSANFSSVCAALRNKYPDTKFVVCGGQYENEGGRPNFAYAFAAAKKIGALVATPEGSMTFGEQYRTLGRENVRSCIDAATEPSGEFGIAAGGDEPEFQSEPPRWPNPVNGTVLIGDTIDLIRHYIILPRNAILALVLWIFVTHNQDDIRVAPILAVTSPVLECGKTTLLGIIERLVFRPAKSSNLTTAVLFRLIDQFRPTLLIDEAETFLANSEEMRGMLNAGHTRESAYVQRLEKGRIRKFKTFGLKLIAGIGQRAATIMSRSIVIELQRKRSDESVIKYAPSENDEMVALRARIARWSQDNRAAIANAKPESPDLGNDRAQDNWEPLLANAHCLGEIWFDRASTAAVELTVRQEKARCTGEELLRDIKAVFGPGKANRITTASLIDALCADLEKPWCCYNNGKAISPRQLGKLLKDFKIASKDLRTESVVKKGFELDQFEDAFARYAPDAPK